MNDQMHDWGIQKGLKTVYTILNIPLSPTFTVISDNLCESFSDSNILILPLPFKVGVTVLAVIT